MYIYVYIYYMYMLTDVVSTCIYHLSLSLSVGAVGIADEAWQRDTNLNDWIFVFLFFDFFYVGCGDRGRCTAGGHEPERLDHF